MTDVRRLFGDERGYYDYEPIINSFGRNVLQIDTEGYQGDSWVLYDNIDYDFNLREPTRKIGYLEYGWGSCSGCDALQACNSIDEVQELADELEQSIKWFDGYKEALDWFETHDWKGDWSFGMPAKKAFVGMATIYLVWKANSDD